MTDLSISVANWEEEVRAGEAVEELENSLHRIKVPFPKGLPISKVELPVLFAMIMLER